MTIDTQLLHFLIIIIKLYIFPRQDFFFFFCGFHFSSPISQQVIYIFFFSVLLISFLYPHPALLCYLLYIFHYVFLFFYIYKNDDGSFVGISQEKRKKKVNMKRHLISGKLQQ